MSNAAITQLSGTLFWCLELVAGVAVCAVVNSNGAGWIPTSLSLFKIALQWRQFSCSICRFTL
jgi:hypothetical protein